MADPSVIEKTIDEYLGAFTDGDAETWLACFAPEAWVEDPVGSPRRNGREAIGEFFVESHALADSIELRPTGIRTVIGDEAVFTMQARPTMGGATYAIDVIDHMTFDADGKIISVRAFFDYAKLAPATD